MIGQGLPCTCRHREVLHPGRGACLNASCGCRGYSAASPTTLFETNALSYLASHGISDVWAGWLISRGLLTDMNDPRPPREGDVINKETLDLLPRHIELEPREPTVMGVDAL